MYAEGERRLAIYNVEDSEFEQRVDLPVIVGVRHPAWLRDGKKIAFSATTDRASDLYMVELASSALTRLTEDAYTAIQPAFSPDGSRLVFVTDRGPRTNLDLLDFGNLRLATLAFRPLHIGRRGRDAENPRLVPLDIARSSLVRGYGFDSFDLSECTAVSELQPCPELDRLIGSRIGVLNFELRLALLGALPIELYYARPLQRPAEDSVLGFSIATGW